MRYAFIFNPTAGQGNSEKKLRNLKEALAKSGLTCQLFVTERPGHAIEIACDAAKAFDAVVAVGGDGTVQEVAAGVIQSGRKVHLGVIPSGTGNDFVKVIGMTGSLDEALEALMSAHPEGVDYGVIEWTEDALRKRRVFVNAVGAGFDAQVARNVSAFKMLPGISAYLAAVFKTLRHWKHPDVLLTRVDGDEVETSLFSGPCFLVTAGNGYSSGGGFLLTPDALASDGLFDVCVIGPLTIPRILTLLPGVFKGRHVYAKEVQIFRAEKLRMKVKPGIPVHADGEILARRATLLDLTLVPKGLSVLVRS